MRRYAAVVAACAAALASCKMQRADSALQGVEEDRALLPQRVAVPEESKDVLRPGPGYALLQGEDQTDQKERIKALVNSPAWDELQLLGKDQSGAYVLYDYQVDLQFAGANGGQLHWTIPAVASFAAPMPTMNLLVQMKSGFYTGPMPIPFQRRQMRSSQEGAPPLDFIDLELYREPPPVAEPKPQAGAPKEAPPKRELPPDALYTAGNEGVRHLPLYYVKNLTGPAVNVLNLTYGSLFFLNDEGQIGGSGFGIWLGEDLPLAQLRTRFPRVLVLGTPASDADRAAIKALATTLQGDSVVKPSATAVKATRTVPAFDAQGLVVGTFSVDNGLPKVASVGEYIQRSNQRPTKVPEPVQPTLPPPTPEPVKPKDLPRTGTWEFTQYADGSKWRFDVSFWRHPDRYGRDAMTIRDIRIYRDNSLYGSTLELGTIPERADVTLNFDGWWYHKIWFRRLADKPEKMCQVSMDIYGYPLIGWDKHILKEGRCP